MRVFDWATSRHFTLTQHMVVCCSNGRSRYTKTFSAVSIKRVKKNCIIQFSDFYLSFFLHFGISLKNGRKKKHPAVVLCRECFTTIRITVGKKKHR